MQFCVLCGGIIDPAGSIATIYFEMLGIGAFELNIHTECLIMLEEQDNRKNGQTCILCRTPNTDSFILVRQLDNLQYPIHTICLEDLLEQFASRFSDQFGEAGLNSDQFHSESGDAYQDHIGLIPFKSRN